MAKKIAVQIRKGGSGKTTVSTNLATALAKKGKKVLLVDLDPQANATIALGIDPISLPFSLADLFFDAGHEVSGVVIVMDTGLCVLPAHPDLMKAEQGLGNLDYDTLQGILEPVENNYDFIIFDTPPAESKLTLNALAYADSVLIPLQTHFLALQGLKQALEEIEKIKKINPFITVLGILPTMVQANTNISKVVMDQLEKEYKNILLPYSIDFSVKFVESTLAGVPLVAYDESHKGSKQFIKLAEDLIHGK